MVQERCPAGVPPVSCRCPVGVPPCTASVPPVFRWCPAAVSPVPLHRTTYQRSFVVFWGNNPPSVYLFQQHWCFVMNSNDIGRNRGKDTTSKKIAYKQAHTPRCAMIIWYYQSTCAYYIIVYIHALIYISRHFDSRSRGISPKETGYPSTTKQWHPIQMCFA